MEQTKLAPAGSFCWNAECPDYGQVGHGNMRKFGRTDKGVQRYQCKTCKHTSAETKGTVFHGCHHSQETILECLAMLADRNSLAAIHRIKGVKEETVSEWLQRAAAHVEQIEAVLLANYRLSRAQLDALWTYVGHKGEKGGMMKKRYEFSTGMIAAIPINTITSSFATWIVEYKLYCSSILCFFKLLKDLFFKLLNPIS